MYSAKESNNSNATIALFSSSMRPQQSIILYKPLSYFILPAQIITYSKMARYFANRQLSCYKAFRVSIACFLFCRSLYALASCFTSSYSVLGIITSLLLIIPETHGVTCAKASPQRQLYAYQNCMLGVLFERSTSSLAQSCAFYDFHSDFLPLNKAMSGRRAFDYTI